MKEKEIKSYEIVLENCECFEFDPKDVMIEFDGLGKHFYGYDEFTCVEHTLIGIHRKAKAKGGWENERWQDRIDKDITQIHVNYSDGSSICFWPKWCDDSDYENSFETDIKGHPLMLYYIISKDKTKFKGFDIME